MKTNNQNLIQPVKKLSSKELEQVKADLERVNTLIEKVDNYAKKLETDFNEKTFELGNKKDLERIELFLRNFAIWTYGDDFYLDQVLKLLTDYIKEAKDDETIKVKFILPECIHYYMSKVNGVGDYLTGNVDKNIKFTKDEFLEIHNTILKIYKETEKERVQINFVTYNEERDKNKLENAKLNLGAQLPINLSMALRIAKQTLEINLVKQDRSGIFDLDEFIKDVIDEAITKGIINSDWKIPE